MALAFLKRIPMYANVGENHSILRFIYRRGSFRGLIFNYSYNLMLRSHSLEYQ